MNCQRCQQRILHSVTAGEISLPLEVSLHRNSCAICREFHLRQQGLFHAVDAGLYSIANHSVPPSLLPGLRLRLEENPAPSRASFPGWSLALFTTALVLALFGTFALRRPTADPHSPELTAILPQPLAKTGSPVQTTCKPQVLSRERRSKSASRANQSASPEPEVIVLAEERHAYSKYLTSASEPGPRQGPEQAKVPLMPVSPVQPLSDGSEQIALVQIESLEVLPLQGAGEK